MGFCFVCFLLFFVVVVVIVVVVVVVFYDAKSCPTEPFEVLSPDVTSSG